MLRNWGKLSVVFMLACILLLGSAAFAEGITLEEALTQVGSVQGDVLLSGDFSALDYFSSMDYVQNSGKIVVLRRVGPEKEFTVSKQVFSDDFNGVDVGETKVYLDMDAMAMIPDEFRAATVDEIGNVIMFETFYLHAGTISSYSAAYETSPSARGLDGAMKDESTELPGEEEVNALEYKAVFTGHAVAALYNAEDGSSLAFDLREFPYAELRSNPEASNVSELMYAAAAVYNACQTQDEETVWESALELILYESVMTEDQLNKLVELLSADVLDYTAFADFMLDIIWDGAGKLCELDKEYGKLYQKAIDEQSLEGVFYLLSESDYNSISKSDIVIKLNKDYMGKIDMNVLEEMRTDTLDLLNQINWDPEMLYVLYLLSE
ncbi:MAG: hypothetical protein IKJ11_08055 [Clostridia bacterium]|nr:hypothetical protein [Clostridia bacterium]